MQADAPFIFKEMGCLENTLCSVKMMFMLPTLAKQGTDDNLSYAGAVLWCNTRVYINIKMNCMLGCIFVPPLRAQNKKKDTQYTELFLDIAPW